MILWMVAWNCAAGWICSRICSHSWHCTNWAFLVDIARMFVPGYWDGWLHWLPWCLSPVVHGCTFPSPFAGKSLFALFLEQFDDLLVKILLAAAVVSFVSHMQLIHLVSLCEMNLSFLRVEPRAFDLSGQWSSHWTVATRQPPAPTILHIYSCCVFLLSIRL